MENRDISSRFCKMSLFKEGNYFNSNNDTPAEKKHASWIGVDFFQHLLTVLKTR